MQRLLATALAIAVVLIAATPLAVSAQVGGLTISTPYPSVTVDPGGAATFDLAITTAVPERVDLSVTTSPGEGWTTRLTGGGSTISAVYTSQGTAEASPTTVPMATATLEVNVPLEVQPGAYSVVLQARAASGATQSLSIDLTVEQAGLGAVTLSAQNPVQQGRAGANLTFDVQLRNDTNQETTFSLDVQGPAAWDLTAVPAGATSAASFVVAAGATQRVTVTASSPDDAEAGDYVITMTALGGPEPATIDLGARITGSYSLALNTSDDRLNARVTIGAETKLTLVVENTGRSPLEGVTFSATPPTGWTVTFAPETVETLAPGATANVEATLKASDTAVAGDYVVTLRTNSTTQGASASDSVEIRTTVETSPLWGFVGIALIIAVVVGLFLVFRQYGRR